MSVRVDVIIDAAGGYHYAAQSPRVRPNTASASVLAAAVGDARRRRAPTVRVDVDERDLEARR